MQNESPRRSHRRSMSTSNNEEEEQNRLAEALLSELIDDATMGVVFEIHRAARCGWLATEDGGNNPNFPGPPPERSQYPLVDAPDLDVFGQPPLKKQHECICPSCQRNLAAARFAPHLEKCMGMGRNSSRIASRRIANSSKEGNSSGAGPSGGIGGGFVSGLLSDDEDDADWTLGGSEKKRKKKDRHLGKRSKGQKVKNGNSAGEMSLGATAADSLYLPLTSDHLGISPGASAPLSYDCISFDERHSFLVHTCGVVSEHTGKLCTRSLRCPQHSDDQRRNIRLSILGPLYDQDEQGLGLDVDLGEGEGGSMVDVDSYEDGDGQAVREALTRASSWEQAAETSSTSSPADSSSTSSSSSKKPVTKSKKKAKSSKCTSPTNMYNAPVTCSEDSY